VSYYTPQSDEPFPGSRLSIHLERPPLSRPNEAGTVMERYPGPRFRLIIEGESGFFDRIDRALAATLAEIQTEIKAAERDERIERRRRSESGRLESRFET
jgi:hypothetical protein